MHLLHTQITCCKTNYSLQTLHSTKSEIIFFIFRYSHATNGIYVLCCAWIRFCSELFLRLTDKVWSELHDWTNTKQNYIRETVSGTEVPIPDYQNRRCNIRTDRHISQLDVLVAEKTEILKPKSIPFGLLWKKSILSFGGCNRKYDDRHVLYFSWSEQPKSKATWVLNHVAKKWMNNWSLWGRVCAGICVWLWLGPTVRKEGRL
jgi:hypothetical protein